MRDALAKAQDDLRYRDLLLHEANHRTKNALQLVMSALSRHASKTSDAVIHDALETAIGRIEKINETHSLLAYRSGPDVIGVSSYLRRLGQAIAASFDSGQVTMEMDLDVDVDVAWNRDIVVPLGLIVSEALTNGFKYAFPGSRSGKIRVTMRRQNDGLIRLQIEDDGVGIRTERRIGSVGLGLIERFAQRLNGRATVGNRSDRTGTAVDLVFPDPNPGAANATAIASECVRVPFPEQRSRAG